MTEEQVLNTHNAEILLSAANKSIILTTSYALWMFQVMVMPVFPKKNVLNGGK